MHDLRGNVLSRFPITGFTWEHDLVEYEGPLLSQFRSESGDRYLLYWCDSDGNHDRWMILPVTEGDRVRLIVGKLALRRLVDLACRDYVFFVETSEHAVFCNTMLVEGSSVPASYLPDHDSCIEVVEAVKVLGENSAYLLFDSDWELDAVREFVRIYRQAYNFTLAMKKDVVSRVASLPWQGGYSAMHFFKRLAAGIDSEDRIRTEFMQFASPGTMRLHVDSEVAEDLIQIIRHFGRNENAITKAHRELVGAIREQGLNKLDSSDAVERFREDPELEGLLEDFSAVMGYQEQLEKLTSNRSQFESAKILLAQYSRIRSLYNEFTKGDVRLARWELFES